MDAFRCLISNLRDVNGTPCLMMWASNILYMNDPQEFRFGFEIMADALRVIEQELHVKESLCISKIWQDYPSKNISELNSILIDAILEQGNSPYALSFSTKNDYLPMWLNYGDHGKGVCLEFTDYQIIEGSDDDNNPQFIDNLHTKTVCYGSIEGQNSPFNAIKEMYIKYLDSSYYIEDRRDLFRTKLKYLASITVVFAPKLKTNVYKYEDERRIIIRNNHNYPVLFRSSKNGNMVPYIEYPIPVSRLDSVIVGPCANFSLSELAFKMMKDKYGLDLNIKKSNCLYRDY